MIAKSPILVPLGLVISPFVMYGMHKEHKDAERRETSRKIYDKQVAEQKQAQQEVIDAQENMRFAKAEDNCRVPESKTDYVVEDASSLA